MHNNEHIEREQLPPYFYAKEMPSIEEPKENIDTRLERFVKNLTTDEKVLIDSFVILMNEWIDEPCTNIHDVKDILNKIIEFDGKL